MPDSPLVSIIVNCFNGEKFLKRCLDSIINQSYQNWEIIFWDNLSKDKSKNIVNDYLKYPLKYFQSDSFLKLYDARNLAIKKSTGKYICFLDVDDYWEEEKIEAQVEFLENNQNFQMVYSNYYTFDQAKNKRFIQNNFQLPSGAITEELLKKYTIGILTAFLRRDIFDDQIFNNKYEIIGDFDFFIKLSKKINIGCIQRPLANYRVHNENYSKKKIDLYIKELSEWIKLHEGEFSKNGLSLFHQKTLLFKIILKKYIFFLGRVVQW